MLTITMYFIIWVTTERIKRNNLDLDKDKPIHYIVIEKSVYEIIPFNLLVITIL